MLAALCKNLEQYLHLCVHLLAGHGFLWVFVLKLFLLCGVCGRPDLFTAAAGAPASSALTCSERLRHLCRPQALLRRLLGRRSRTLAAPHQLWPPCMWFHADLNVFFSFHSVFDAVWQFLPASMAKSSLSAIPDIHAMHRMRTPTSC